MKERRLKIIVVLMILAVTGLITTQIYWIKHLIDIEEQRFDNNVSEALSDLVDRLDKVETASVLVHKVLPKGNMIFIMDTIQSIKTKPIKFWTEEKKLNIPNLSEASSNVNIELKERIINGKGETVISVESSGKIDTLKIAGDLNYTREKVDSFFITKTELVSNVVDELIDIRSNTSKSVQYDKSYLDTLLTNELLNKGIETKFYYAITDKAKNILLIDSLKDTLSILNTKHRVQLNQKDIFSDANFLSLYFPEQRSYILGSIMSLLGLSLFLILIIIGVFYKTLQMLINQKKITEIKNDLINNITHEFKTPISTISLACDALNEPLLLKNPESLPRYSGMIKDENLRLSSLVENLLNTAAIEKGEFKLEKKNTDVHKILEKISANFEIKVEAKGGKILTQLNAVNSKVFIDEFHFSNIISNLIDNAIKYSKEEIKVEVSTTSINDILYIKIKDSGVGINKHDQKRIFDTFYRVSTGNIHDVKGNGIGLSYAKKMIEAHGGKISVESKLNIGSTFTIELPYE